jgi:hypothetical protein
LRRESKGRMGNKWEYRYPRIEGVLWFGIGSFGYDRRADISPPQALAWHSNEVPINRLTKNAYTNDRVTCTDTALNRRLTPTRFVSH